MGKGKAGESLKRKVYEKHLAKLHEKLVSLQEWVKTEGLKMCIVSRVRTARVTAG
jgi:polyphosphate kinase